MAHTKDENAVPRILIRGAVAMVVFCTLAVIAGSWSGRGLVMTPPSVATEARLLRFTPNPDLSIAVTDPVSGQMVALLSADEDGFIRGVLRGLVRGRAVKRIDGDDVYVLTRYDDGRLSIGDPASGARFDLNSFGSDNLQSFARLLKSREDT